MDNKIVSALQKGSDKTVLVIGAAIIDEVIKIDKLPTSGADIMGELVQANIGGCAWNVLLGLKRLGISPTCGILCGNGANAELIKLAIENNGFEAIFHSKSHDNGKCLAFVEPSGERTFLTFAGAEEYWDNDMFAILDNLRFDYVYLSGYELACPTGDIIARNIASLKGAPTIIVDLGPRIADIKGEVLKELLKCNVIFSMNEDEALSYSINCDNSTDAGEQISTRLGKPVILHAGADGAYMFDGDVKEHVPVRIANIVDTIGAGDAHTAGLIAGLAHGLAPAEALALGNEVARYVVERVGSDCSPTVEELLNEVNK